MDHTDGILGFALFILVCSSLCRDETLFTDDNKEQVLAAMVCAVVVRRSVCFQSTHHLGNLFLTLGQHFGAPISHRRCAIWNAAMQGIADISSH